MEDSLSYYKGTEMEKVIVNYRVRGSWQVYHLTFLRINDVNDEWVRNVRLAKEMD